jgi:hypothetical protein
VRWSFDHLSPTEARVFTTLSLLRGFDFATATRLWTENLDPFDVVDALDSLVRESLLQFDGRRYRMLEPVRLFAESELDSWPEEDKEAWKRRLVGAVLDRFRDFERDWCQLHPLAIANAASPNLDVANARVALDICLSRGDLATASQLLKTAGGSLFESGEFNLLRSFAHQLLERSRQTGSTADRAALLWAVGQSSWRMGEPTIALDALRESAELYRDAKDSFGTATSTTFLAAAHWDLGQMEETTETMANALDDWRVVDPVLFGHAGAPIFYWYVERDPHLCRELVDRAVASNGEDGLNPHVREVRALLAIDEHDLDAALQDLVEAANQWAQANNSGCLAHTLEAAAFWAVRSERIELARTLRSALREYRQHSGIPPLALETMTSERVERALKEAPKRLTPDDEIDTIGLSGAHQLFVVEAHNVGSER